MVDGVNIHLIDCVTCDILFTDINSCCWLKAKKQIIWCNMTLQGSNDQLFVFAVY